MTAASFTAVGLSAAPMAASAGEPLPPGSASGLVFADVMVEAMACAPVEDAFALGITVEAGGEWAGAFALKQPSPPNRLSSPVASEREEATSAATLEALAQAIAGQFRSPGVPVPPLATPAESEGGHDQQTREVAPQPSLLPTLKQPAATERAEAVGSSQAPVKSAQSVVTSDSPRDPAGQLQPGMSIESAAFTNAAASHLPDAAMLPRPSGIAPKSDGGENTSEIADDLSSLAEVIGKVPPLPLTSNERPDAQAGLVTSGNFPGGPPVRPLEEELSASVRLAQRFEEEEHYASAPPAALVKRPDQSAIATSNAPENQAAERPVGVERTVGLVGQRPSGFVDLTTPAGETVAPLKAGAAMVSPTEAHEPQGRAEPAPSSLAGELAAKAGTFTTRPATADRENHLLPVRPVQSAAEARFAVPPQTDSSAPAAAPLPFRAGTGTAELGDGMKNATEPKQIAGLPQQNLPELGVAFEVAAPELLRRGGVRLVPAAGDAKVHPDSSSQLISFFAPDQPVSRAPEEAGVLPATLGVKPPPLTESLQSSVLKHITELRHIGATEMAVVLKPDAETQLALRLTMGSNGEVLVQARCEQGDAQALTANWGEIRQSLALQGVRLGALEFSPERGQDTFQPHAGNGGPSPDGQPSSQRHGQPWPETLDDLLLTGSHTEPLVRRGLPRPSAGQTRLLESWA